MNNDDLSNKEYLRGRSDALREVISCLDERLNKGVGTWAYTLHQQLEWALNGTEKVINRIESKDQAQ